MLYCNKANSFTRSLKINLSQNWNGFVYITQWLFFMFIRLFKMLTWVKQSSSISIAGKLKSNLMLKMTEIRKTLVSFVDFVKTKKNIWLYRCQTLQEARLGPLTGNIDHSCTERHLLVRVRLGVLLNKNVLIHRAPVLSFLWYNWQKKMFRYF